MTTTTSARVIRHSWSRLRDTVVPAPAADRLVRVATIGEHMRSLAEGSLADVCVSPVVQPLGTARGEHRYAVLVEAKDGEIARQTLAGL